MQILVAKQFNLTMYEVPYIAVNTMHESMILKDDEINQNLKYNGLEIEILDTFSKHPDFDLFKKSCCEAFSDSIKFTLSQMELASKK